MANKKCPKCGEDNPAEAVMCWACYTPLTASAGAAMTAGVGMGGGGTATLPRPGTAIGASGADDGSTKKPIDPRIFAGAGVLLVLALIGGFVVFGSSGGGDETPPSQSDPSKVTPGSNFPSGSPGVGPAQPPLNPLPSSGGTTTTPNSDPPPPALTWVTSPNPTYKTAAFAIASSQPGITPQEALNLARTAKQQTAGRWANTQIAVFASADSAQAFRTYMNQHRGAPLTEGDFQALAGSWSNVMVFYETRGKAERVRQPSQNPSNWWNTGS